ncbi:hypothetical protein [Burkholderia cenocepacia]|uniref:hypothetical protein n=1 Tax=Burkholderia cenocepacia TaxID=95486 RepID=UPI0012AED8F7|nr:hypothetical protein [Burkholderia cenocepacia]
MTDSLSMNRTYLKVCAAELKLAHDGAGCPISGLYELTVYFRNNGEPHRIWRVHVPEALHSLLSHGTVCGVVIETLELGSFASRFLPHSPTHVVLALATAPGDFHYAEIPALVRLRAGAMAIGYAAILGGVAVLTAGLSVWVGVASCLVGSHCLRTGLHVPTVAKFDVSCL